MHLLEQLESHAVPLTRQKQVQLEAQGNTPVPLYTSSETLPVQARDHTQDTGSWKHTQGMHACPPTR